MQFNGENPLVYLQIVEAINKHFRMPVSCHWIPIKKMAIYLNDIYEI
jgi:hypothetical protein